jgi:hypothetical protein
VSEEVKDKPSSVEHLRKYQWRAGQSGNPSGRVAGFRHFSAKLFATMLDARIDEKGHPLRKGEDGYDESTPFPIAALNLYMQRVLGPKGKGEALFDFVERLLPHLDELDGILMNQRSQDLKFLNYLVYKYCFDEQQQVLLTKKRLVVLICGRRAGKTVVIACLLILVAISHEKGDVLYLGRTAKSAYDIIWRTLLDVLNYIGIPFTPHLADQTIEFNTGVKIFVKGTASKADIENLRGLGLRLAVKDECQSDSHGKLKMLVEEILVPATKDYEDSQVVLSGSPPRIEGSYQEEKYSELNAQTARFNWNMSVNPHIPHHETILEETLANNFAGNANDTVYLREHVGKIGAYDTEALVFRITKANHYAEASLVAWIASQPVTDIFFSGGIDYGFDDFDSCVIIMASINKPERFKLYGYKGNRTGISDFADKLKLGLARVLGNPIFSGLPQQNKQVTWYCDTEGLGKKITFEIAQQFNLSVSPAYQGQPEMMLEMLQDEVKTGRWKHPAPQVIDGKEIVDPFEEEARKIVFARDEADHLTRRIDDDIFHPEITKSILYAMRYVWLKSKVKIGSEK